MNSKAQAVAAASLLLVLTGCSHPDGMHWIIVDNSESSAQTCPISVGSLSPDPVKINQNTVKATTVCFYTASATKKLARHRAELNAEQAKEIVAELYESKPLRNLPRCAVATKVDEAQIWARVANKSYVPINVALGTCAYISYGQNTFGAASDALQDRLLKIQQKITE